MPVLNVTKLVENGKAKVPLNWGEIIRLRRTVTKLHIPVVCGFGVSAIIFDKNQIILNSSLSLYNIGIYINRLKILFRVLTA